MKAPLAIFLLVLLAAAAAGDWWWSRAAATSPAAAVPGAASTDRGPREAAQPLVDSRAGARAAPRVETAETARAEAPFEPPTDARWIAGSLVLPPGIPADERLAVVAKGRSFAGTRVREHAAVPAADGTFRVAVAKESRRAELELEARYLFLVESRSLDLADIEEPVVLEPRLGGRVVGGIVLPAATGADAFAGVELSFAGRLEGRRFTRRLRAGADGTFDARGLPPGEHTVSVSADGFLDPEPARLALRAGETLERDFALTPGARVCGRVVDARGAGVARAKVLALARESNGFTESRVPLARASTQGDGTFELSGLRPANVELEATADGYRPATLDLGALHDGDAREDLELALERGATITGAVRWPDGRPVPEARVVARPVGIPGAVEPAGAGGQVETGDDGTFTLGGLEAGDFVVDATARPWIEDTSGERTRRRRDATWRSAEVTVRAPAAGIELRLARSRSIAGQVVDDAGRPLERFTVAAQRARSGSFAPDRTSAAFRDANGRFVLDGVDEDVWSVSATALGHGSSAPSVVDTHGPAPEVRLVVPRTGEVAGVVRSPAGAPVPGATIALRLDSATTWPGDARMLRADGDGRFVAEGLSPGTQALVASARGFASSAETRVEVLSGARSEVDLTLRAGAAITGLVLPSAGAVGGRVVVATGPGAEVAATDETGRFALAGLAPGTWRVELRPEGHVQGRKPGVTLFIDPTLSGGPRAVKTVELAEGETAHVELGGDAARLVRVFGRVVRGGEPVARIEVRLSRPADGGYGESAARTDENGRFELRVAGPGSTTCSVGSDFTSQLTFQVEIPDAGEHELPIELPGGALRGVLRGPDGAPAERQFVMAHRVDVDPSTQTTARSADDGSFAIENLAAGRYVLRAGGRPTWVERGAEVVPYGRVVLPGIELRDGEERTGLAIELPQAGWLEGRVTGPSGAALASALVVATALDGTPIDPWPTHTGDDGRFHCDGLPPGEVLVRATQDGRASEPLRVRIVAGRGSEVELRVD